MTPAEPASLGPTLDWQAAAQTLIDGCAYLPTPDERLRWLEGLCDALGAQLYPALIGVLHVVNEQGSPAARQAVSQALMDGLQSGRLPTGRRAAWGRSDIARPGQLPMTRSLGPIEYLCAWFDDPGSLQPLSASQFDLTLRGLLALVSAHPQGRQRYSERLLAQAQHPVDGALTRRACEGLQALGQSWQRCGNDMQAPVTAFVRAVQNQGDVKAMAERLQGL